MEAWRGMSSVLPCLVLGKVERMRWECVGVDDGGGGGRDGGRGRGGGGGGVLAVGNGDGCVSGCGEDGGEGAAVTVVIEVAERMKKATVG